MNKYTHEKNKLLFGFDIELEELFKKTECFIVGGAVTSVFSNKEINDIDVYFRDYKSLELVLKALFNVGEDEFSEAELKIIPEVTQFTLIHQNHTNKSILFSKNELKVQLIYFKFFNSVEEIFNTFDFTINMGAYDCAKDEFILHENFLKDIAQRRLVVNPNTSFPIISLLRVDKYKQRGYSISRKDFVNLCLAVNKLDIKSWDELADAIGGMYGYIYTDIFDTKEEFSMDKAIDQLTNLVTKLESKVITGLGTDYYELIARVRKNLNIIEPDEDKVVYKKVLRTDNPLVFKAPHQTHFLYEINKILNGGDLGVYVYKNVLKAKNHWTGNTKTEALICLKGDKDSIISREGSGAFRLIGNFTIVSEIDMNTFVKPEVKITDETPF